MNRRRTLLGINLVSFFWGLGMGASMPVIPLLSYQFVPDLALAGVVTAVGGVGALFMGYLSSCNAPCVGTSTRTNPIEQLFAAFTTSDPLGHDPH